MINLNRNKTMIRTFYKSLELLIVICVVGCSSDNSSVDIDESNDLYSDVLKNISVNVITETYRSLYNNAEQFNNELKNINNVDASKQEKLKSLWISSRLEWEQTEGFLFGPVDNEGLDPSIDTWPIDLNSIKGILSSDNVITSSLLDENNDVKGFHTIEYLIWGSDGQKTHSDFTTRELEYLKACGENLLEKCKRLYESWSPEFDNFAGNFINAGESSLLYKSQKNALQELVQGLEIIADEVANGKIETPLTGNNGEPKPEAEESPFSDNSKKDFIDNIISIENIYLGDYNTNKGKGLSDIVILKDTDLDKEMLTQIETAKNTISDIPGTFSEAIFDNKDEVKQAQQSVRDLLTLIQSKLIPFITNL